MRTRFLGIDYFNFPSNQDETLEFLRLPPPRLHPSNLSSFEDLRCFDVVPVLSQTLEIETFPIDDALSKFFADVFPRFVDVETGEFTDSRSCSREACSDSLRSSAKDQSPEEKNEFTCYSMGEIGLEVVEFEIPQLDLSLESAWFFEEEKMQLFPDLEEIDNNVDMLDQVLILHHPRQILESLCSVDDITPKFCMEQKGPFPLEDAGSSYDQVDLLNSSFPLLEVDEISLGVFSSIHVEEEFQLLENMVTQPCPEMGYVSKELLVHLEIDILENLGDQCVSRQCFESMSSCSNFCLEMDLISTIELPPIEESSSFGQGIHDNSSMRSASLVCFEEIQFLDLSFNLFLEVFSNSSTICEAETCEQMFEEESRFRKFNDLIVTHELTLVDDSFHSLPIPILADHEKIRSPSVFVEQMLAALEPQRPSASDGIYLDWQFSEENYDSCDKYSACRKQVLGISSYDMDSDLYSTDDGVAIFDFVFSIDTPNAAYLDDCKEMLNVLSGGISTISECPNDNASSKLSNDGRQRHGNGEVLSDLSSDRVSTTVEPRLPFNDLNFFLNPREATVGKNSKPAVIALDANTIIPAVSSINQTAKCASTVQLQQWDLKLHQVMLSDDILQLIDNFQKNYLAILKSDTGLTKTQHLWLAMDDTKLLSLSKESLIDCIKKTNVRGTSIDYGDNTCMALVALCAIKQMAWYLCYYGVHTTYLYVNKLCKTLDGLKSRLCFLQSSIEVMYGKAERNIIASHPSLSVIQAILQSNNSHCGLKVLIVAEQVFWWPLKRLLSSMRISYQGYNKEFIDTNLDVLLHSDCCLISNEYISPSFPFGKFNMILEYGGSCGSSRLSTISSKLVGFPCLHFLKVELEKCSAPKSLCEGVYLPLYSEFTTELEELLNFVPCEEKYSMGSPRVGKAFSTTVPVPCVPAMETEPIRMHMPSFPDTIIVVNTRNLDQEMIISRRSTYQRILALEKQGAQILERDLKLPVDVIISAAMCLVWYDCRNIRKKTSSFDAVSSSLPLCIEYIATNVLTTLSFTFSCCILIFEGENSFLATVMELSDKLYAAAASLRIGLQLFCSYSSELTDQIILSCIGSATKSTRHTYPKMPESETLAESFLMTCPSMNPLSAHAILSSGGTLVEFLGWPHERRVRAIQKYHVPDESVSLLSTLCRYGEREDSRSGMTDCSSSVSSAPDSEIFCRRTDSVRKKGKYISSPEKSDIPMNDAFHMAQLKQSPDGSLNHPRVSNPQDTWMSVGEEIFDGIENPGVSVRNLLMQNQNSEPSGVAVLLNPSEVCKHPDFRMSRGTETPNALKMPMWGLDDKLFGPEEPYDAALMNKLDCHRNKNSANRQEELNGEIIDGGASFSACKDSSFTAKSLDLSFLEPETDKDPLVGNSRAARKLSFSSCSLPTFPTAAEISWDSIAKHGQSFTEAINGHTDAVTKQKLPSRHLEKPLEGGFVQKTATNFPWLSLQKDTQHHGGTPLTNAVHSGEPQRGSPWTVQFLNRIREKRRSLQKSLPPATSPLCYAYSGNACKVTKRVSPSILDFYKYQGGSTPRVINDKKRRCSTQPSTSSKNEKNAASIHRTWTPDDKRARRTLSFSTGGGGGQSKLVWNDTDAQTIDRRSYRQV